MLWKNDLAILDEKKINGKIDAALSFFEEEVMRNCNLESDFDFSTVINAENVVYLLTVKSLELVFSDLYTGSGNQIYKEKRIRFGFIYRRDFQTCIERLIYSSDGVTGRLHLMNSMYNMAVR